MVARLARRRAAFTVRTARWGYGAGRGRDHGEPRPGHYDYEGSAREVTEPRGELPPRHDDAQR